MTDENLFKAGYITLLGLPNVGKSTLLNRLLDFRLSIVSPRPQTTRRRVLGIINKPGFQIIVLDTPGILNPKYKLQKALAAVVAMATEDADILLYLVESKKMSAETRIFVGEEIEVLQSINRLQKPVILAINKIDLYSKSNILPLIETYSDFYPFLKIIPVSALKNDGLEDLEKELQEALPFHAPFYDTGIITDQPERFFVAEFIREQIFLYFREEIPYSTEVQIEEFIERPQAKDLIRAVIFVERESQKGIIIGKQGTALKNIGLKSRRVIESFLNREIYLELRVKVNKNWRENEEQIRKFGY
jgi:GTP-binding protein Era